RRASKDACPTTRRRTAPTLRSGPGAFTEPGQAELAGRTAVVPASRLTRPGQAPRTTAPGARVQASSAAVERRSEVVSATCLPGEHPAAPASPGQQEIIALQLSGDYHRPLAWKRACQPRSERRGRFPGRSPPILGVAMIST